MIDKLNYMKPIIASLKEFYGYYEDTPIIKEMKRLSNQKFTISDDTPFKEIVNIRDPTNKFPKLIIQFLFMNNFTILKSASPNAIRHIFPPSVGDFENFIKFLEFLKKLFEIIDIDIAIKQSKDNDDLKKDLSQGDLYIYFKNYKSIFNLLLYWDDSLGKIPKNKIADLKETFEDLEVYVHFKDIYMDQVFGEEGLINREKLTITKFFDNIFDLSQYKRHSIYKWRDECFFPATVIYDLNKSIYREMIDTDFFKYIKYIKIGKSQVIKKLLLDKIKNNFKGKFDKFIPISESMLGFVISQPSHIE
ncbi:MAG: hypothetical protein ACFFCV_13840, partial [Promethearchaeota archaeon]